MSSACLSQNYGCGGVLTTVVAVSKFGENCIGKTLSCFATPFVWRAVIDAALARVTILCSFVGRNERAAVGARTELCVYRAASCIDGISQLLPRRELHWNRRHPAAGGSVGILMVRIIAAVVHFQEVCAKSGLCMSNLSSVGNTSTANFEASHEHGCMQVRTIVFASCA